VRDCVLANLTGAKVHIAHVSTRGALEAIRTAKNEGLQVTCEVTPHHIALTHEAVAGYDTQAKMNPPLRTESDRLALLAAIADGTVDAIATDHAPCTPDEKCVEFSRARSGSWG
jgi:dihydroorotase